MHRMIFSLFTLLVLLAVSTRPAPVSAQTATVCDPARPAEAGMIAATIESGGMERRFNLFLPTSYDGTTALPIVMGLHGFASNPEQQQTFSRYEQLGEQEGFITVYPAGTGLPRRWNAGGAFDGTTDADRVDDEAFFSDLLDYLQTTYCTDPARVYISGLSNGAGMSQRIACEMADRVTAIGGIAGAYVYTGELCNPSRPVPVIAMHGMLDPIVPYEGTPDGDDFQFPAIEAWAAEWAARNECGSPLITDLPAAVMTIREWTDCAEGTEVILYTLPDGGHTWSGGLELPEFLVGKTRTDIDASVILWEFFQRFALPTI